MDAWIDTYHAVRALDARGHVRLPDRQRRRRPRGGQPPAPDRQPRRRRAARPRRAVPHEQAPARLLPGVRRPRPAARLRVARRARRRQARRRPAIGRARVAAAAGDSRPRGSDLVLGGWANPYRDADRQVDYLLDARLHRRVLPDADRLAPRRRPRWRASSSEARPPGRDAAGRVRRLLLPERATRRRSALLRDFIPVPAEGLTREFGEGAAARGGVRAHDPGDARGSACGASTSATCRCAARTRRSRRSGSGSSSGDVKHLVRQ